MALAEMEFAQPGQGENLSEAEKRKRMLVEGAINLEAFCGPNYDPTDPAHDPAHGEQWGPERTIRADVMRWLCADKDASALVEASGIRVLGARVSAGSIWTGTMINFPLQFANCLFLGNIDFAGAHLAVLSLEGSRIHELPEQRPNC